MKNIGFSREQCRQGLAGYLAEIEELMEIAERADSLSAADVQQAQALLANLKACLKRDHALRDTAEGSGQMTDIEAAIFAPAIHQAYADLHIRTNSRPSAVWHSNLYDVQITISHALSQLRE